MRGGTDDNARTSGSEMGLSPHARGNPAQSKDHLMGLGPIPACAGEPQWFAGCVDRMRAYPRMRGGTSATRRGLPSQMGLSPHARGNHGGSGAGVWALRPIPACAGEPGAESLGGSAVGAYPRMRGGTARQQPARQLVMGLSPHARGNPASKGCSINSLGPIPACAGEPADLMHGSTSPWAYPRMRGGTIALSPEGTDLMGLSPHARGNQHVHWVVAAGQGPIPACAGEPWSTSWHSQKSRAYPRMRGGTCRPWPSSAA